MVKKQKIDPIPKTAIGNALYNETDRGCVLVGAAFIDYKLSELLHAWFLSNVGTKHEKRIRQTLKDGAPPLMGSLGVRNTVAFLSGLIDEECFSVIDALRSMRNHFAHNPGEVILNDAALAPIKAVMTGGAVSQLAASLWQHDKDGTPVSPFNFIKGNKSFSDARKHFVFLSIAAWHLISVTTAQIKKGNKQD